MAFFLFPFFFLFAFHWVISKFLSSNSLILCSICSPLLQMVSVAFLISFIDSALEFRLGSFKKCILSHWKISHFKWDFFFFLSWIHVPEFSYGSFRMVILNSFTSSSQNFIPLILISIKLLSFSDGMFPCFFIFFAVLYCCFHIWNSRHLLKTLLLAFGWLVC